MKVWVQSKRGSPQEPFNISGVISSNGFVQRGHWLEFFNLEDIDTIEWRREEPVIGGVGTYRRIFEKLGVAWERGSYPLTLQPFLGREIGTIPLSQLPAFLVQKGCPIFIKPALDDKRFTGFVCQRPDDRWNPRLAQMEPDGIVCWAEAVRFMTEYRVYVLNGRIQNISRYTGKIDNQPDPKVIRAMVDAYTDAPIAYGLDVGVDHTGRTLLVEVNEAMALGNYGLPSMLHAKMLASRWFELVGDLSRMGEECDALDSPSFINQF